MREEGEVEKVAIERIYTQALSTFSEEREERNATKLMCSIGKG